MDTSKKVIVRRYHIYFALSLSTVSARARRSRDPKPDYFAQRRKAAK
jgi:hypothetical protein